jgi:hypothetical protein
LQRQRHQWFCPHAGGEIHDAEELIGGAIWEITKLVIICQVGRFMRTLTVVDSTAAGADFGDGSIILDFKGADDAGGPTSLGFAEAWETDEDDDPSLVKESEDVDDVELSPVDVALRDFALSLISAKLSARL